MEAPSSKRRGGGAGDQLNEHVDWFLWRPCVGVNNLCPPLAKWSEMLDGTLDLADVKEMHSVMDELIYQKERADG